MIEIFYPKHKVDKVQDIELSMLKNKGIKGLILDIDNTLVPEHVAEPDENVIKWIERVNEAGFKVCIVSNASQKRVIKFNEKLKVHAIHKASKPSKKAFLKAAELMGIEAEETAVIGDQIFTDIFGGNRLNMFTILVTPIDKKEVFYVKIKRIAEKYVLSKYEKYLMEQKNKI
ncbi:YqeG family HAD IIIA-type phosphatase [Acetivibrio clariflavus]|uniref:HAD phosphatase subfamily IIIA n=1 Tax=Acetivibrio clariflavus (strain DSM 19732 / NBRC 101661 / EBR45) TaxID=720554 RepID=G8M0G1_ACECE|nr:YqeG family HAD IIIA-type phosphatase [Acetivibrio clariflavus]AEV68006.1 HAD phosphatase subfamily IIIA [Acetivibrio clariflavus DSM 19732]HOQ00234.1 YqeG family HAD IIIA-type phosphatase [Acetivibrio clariflavus]HPU40966.1 YqeG family HAD IIIA-type phosphatase [Acetivibrio clariflavus]